MLKVLLELMKDDSFVNIDEYKYKKKNLDEKNLNDFLNTKSKFKSLFSSEKECDNSLILEDFLYEFRKLSIDVMGKIILKTPKCAKWISTEEFLVILKNEDIANWKHYFLTFNPKAMKNIELEIPEKSHINKIGRYILMNKLKEPAINLLENLTERDFMILPNEFITAKEFIMLIELANFSIKDFLSETAQKNNELTVSNIINIISFSNHNLKKDKNFELKLKKILNDKIKKTKNSKKIEVPQFKGLDFSQITNYLELFSLPQMLKSPFLDAFLKQNSTCLNWNTTTIPNSFKQSFGRSMLLQNNFILSYKEWLKLNNESIKIIDSDNIQIKRFNDLIKNFLFQEDIYVASSISLLILKESIELLSSSKEIEKFNDGMSFWEICKSFYEVSDENLRFSSELLFAPCLSYYQFRNKVAHLKPIHYGLSILVVCLALENVRKFMSIL